MGGISSTLSLGLSYCAFSSVSSICNACLGTTAPNTSGRRRSVLLLALAVMLALYFQYSLAPAILGNNSGWWGIFRSIPGLGRLISASWTDGCEIYLKEGESVDQLPRSYEECVGKAGVYRPTFCAFLFFSIASIASYFKPSLNRSVWPAKYSIYLLLVMSSVFVSNHPLFSGIFLHLSRVGAMIFVVIQQVILIDLAYNWNDAWVSKADACDRLEWGSGAKWLRATIAACVSLYVFSFVGIGLLYHFFGGCGENTAIISLTLVGIISVTILQLSGTEGSLLTSSIISLYAVYLGYSSVSKNPHGVCNPQLAKDNDSWDIFIGLLLTCISLAWTGWSWTAEDRFTAGGVKKTHSLGSSAATFRRGHDALLDLDDPFLEYHDNDMPPSGLALHNTVDDFEQLHSPSEVWKLNVVLTLISCWIAMLLTGWGSMYRDPVEEEGVQIHTAANPEVGKLNMVMIAVSQWVALLLYSWTLLAPRLFPDRDFS
eukprot:CCRYP_003500-RA/>CCRYP_003500-RA protein AED:0.30 eAED:0.30 QI:458/1/1/1/0/0/2/152/485